MLAEDTPQKGMKFSEILALVAAVAPASSRKLVRSKSKKRDFIQSPGGMMLILSSESDNDDRNLNEKIEEKRKIFNILDDVELSSEEERDAPTSQVHLSSSSTSESHSLNNIKIIPQLPVQGAKNIPTVNVSISRSVDGTDDLKKIMTSLLHDNKSKDAEIKSLRKELMDLEYSRDHFDEGMIDGDSIRHARIKELSKKAKRLTVSYEKERSINSQLQARITELEARGNQSFEQTPLQSEEKIQKLNCQVKAMKEKLATCIRKVEDERSQSSALKTEIRNLHKVLAQEVGEGYNLDKLIKGESNAKGRIEQISILKEKVKELTRKVQSATRSTDRGTPTSTVVPLDSNDHNGIYKMELSKRKEHEKIVGELEKIKQELIESKKKNEGLAARIKILESTGKEAKSKIGVLLRKTETDDQFIQALKIELSKVQAFKSKDVESEQARETINSLQVQIVKLEAQIVDMEEKLKGVNSKTPDNHDSETASSPKSQNLVASLKQELSSLRSGKSKLEQSLVEEKKNASFLRLQIQRDKDHGTIKADAHSGKPKKDIIEDLKDSIAILSDENQALKVTLKMVSESKSTDLELYQKLLDQTRARLESL